MNHLDHEEVYTLAQQERDYDIAWANLDSLPYPVYDGSGCRYVDLPGTAYGLIDFDGTYRLGLYRPDLSDEMAPMECSHFESFAHFLFLLTGRPME